MTRKDYVTIARIIRDHPTNTPAARYDIEGIARHFADVLEYENSRFDRKRFLTACDVPRGKVSNEQAESPVAR